MAQEASSLRSLLTRARSVEARAATVITRRLEASVVRPLSEALASSSESEVHSETPTDGGVAEELWTLARDATTLCASGDAPLQLVEAAAALQDLACQAATVDDADQTAARLAELKILQAAMAPGIQAESNGPYLVTSAEHLRNWLSEHIPVRPLMALCRCGRSAIKPVRCFNPAHVK